MEYLNFDLWIQRAGNRYKVTVIPPTGMEGYLCDDIQSPRMRRDLVRLGESLPDGDLSEGVQVDFEKLNPVDGAFLKEFGGFLYECLFRDAIRDAFKEAFGKVGHDLGLRVRLIIDPPEIAALPWELMYDRVRDRFLATWDKTSVVRYPNMPEMKRELKVGWPVKVLIAIPDSDEEGDDALRASKEKEIVTKAFKDLVDRGFVRLDFLEGDVSVTTINEKLSEDEYHIFHFIGHGCFENEQGYIKIDLCDDDENPEEVDKRAKPGWLKADSFANLFSLHSSMKLVVLNSCQGAQVSSIKPLSGMVPGLFRRDIPAVVAMQYPIFDDSARTFAQAFYGTLCKGRNRGLLDVAITNARNLMLVKRSEDPDFATPVLFMRTSSGLIFDLHESQPLPRGSSSIHTADSRGPIAKLDQALVLIDEVPRLKALKIAREENLTALNREKETVAKDEDRRRVEQAIVHEHEEVAGVELRLSKAAKYWMRFVWAALLLSFFVLIGAFLGVFNVIGVGDYLNESLHQRIARRSSGAGVFGNGDIRVILVNPNRKANGFPHSPEQRSLDRENHAELINALANAGAKVVALDIVMDQWSTTPFDEELATAIDEAEKKGTHVITGVELNDEGRPEANPPPALVAALDDRLGNVNVGLNYEIGSLGFEGFRPVIRHVELAKQIRGSTGQQTAPGLVPVYPSLILQAIRYFRATDSSDSLQAYLDTTRSPKHLVLVRKNGEIAEAIPVVDNEMSFTISPDSASALGDVRRIYQDVYARRNDPQSLRTDFGGKVVWVGYGVDEDRYNVSGTRSQYGVEIQANAVANIFQRIYVRNISWTLNLAILIAMAVIGIALQVTFLNRFTWAFPGQMKVLQKIVRVPAGLIVATIIYFMTIWFVYSTSTYKIDMTYHVFALFAGYLLGAYMKRKTNV